MNPNMGYFVLPLPETQGDFFSVSGFVCVCVVVFFFFLLALYHENPVGFLDVKPIKR